MIDHDHVLEVVLICRDCDLVMADASEAEHIAERLRRYVTPDSSTSAGEEEAVFDLIETINMGTD